MGHTSRFWNSSIDNSICFPQICLNSFCYTTSSMMLFWCACHFLEITYTVKLINLKNPLEHIYLLCQHQPKHPPKSNLAPKPEMASDMDQYILRCLHTWLMQICLIFFWGDWGQSSSLETSTKQRRTKGWKGISKTTLACFWNENNIHPHAKTNFRFPCIRCSQCIWRKLCI